MKAYLPIFVYAAVYLVIAGGFLFYYFNKRQLRLHRKWWVLLVVLIFLALAGSETYKGFHQISAQRIPSNNELANALSNGSIASDELLFKSPDGYQILIPKGLTYASSSSVVSLIATNRNSDQKTSFTIVVMKQALVKDVDSLVKDLIQIGAKADPPKTYVFEGKGKNTDQRRGYLETSKNGVLMRTDLLLVQQEKSMYRVAISIPKDNFEREQAEIEKVLGSFKVL